VFVFHAWGSLERKASNVGFARELFKAAIKVDPKNEKVWSAWIGMEEENGQLERADELRIRRAEQQWEFEVPANFTTRPSAERSLNSLVENLTKFFRARERSAEPSSQRNLRSFLPEDFQPDISAQDIIPSLSTSSAALSESRAAAKKLVETLRPKEKTARQKEVERLLDDDDDLLEVAMTVPSRATELPEVKLKSGPARSPLLM
jgi:hypothetical protein